jgi:hypothetical protein
MFQARSVARRRPGLPLPQILDRPWIVRAHILVWVLTELVLLVKRMMDITNDDGVLVLSMLRTINNVSMMPDGNGVQRQYQMSFLNKEQPRRAWKHYIKDMQWQYKLLQGTP